MTSHEKIQQFAEQLLAQRANGMVATSLMALAPTMLRQLPTDPEVLDPALYEYAAILLMLRSDDARPLAIVYADELPLPPADAEAEAVEEATPALVQETVS